MFLEVGWWVKGIQNKAAVMSPSTSDITYDILSNQEEGLYPDQVWRLPYFKRLHARGA